MMKSILKELCVFCVMVLFISCGSQQKRTTQKEESKQTGIEMKVSPEKNGGAPQTLDLTVKNNTKEVIQFGANYNIQRRLGDKWIDVDLGNFAVISIMYNLQPGDSGDYKINLFTETVTYPEGDYRIVKQISVGEKEMQPYYANFRIIEPR